jgi:flagellar basal-body rod modification protein FlgD
MTLGISSLSAIGGLLDALGGTSTADPYGSAMADALGVGSTSATGDGTDTLLATGTTDLYGLSKDDFFKMFLAQLQNQDPTKPMDNSEMVGQLAQFSMIQTLQELSAALKGSRLAEASALIGKQVTGFDTDGNQVSGVVDRVDQTADSYYLVVGGVQLAPDGVSTVTDTPPTAA